MARPVGVRWRWPGESVTGSPSGDCGAHVHAGRQRGFVARQRQALEMRQGGDFDGDLARIPWGQSLAGFALRAPTPDRRLPAGKLVLNLLPTCVIERWFAGWKPAVQGGAAFRAGPRVLKIILVAAWFASLALAERLLPAAPRPRGSDPARLTRNLGLWAANTLMNPFVTAPISVAAAALNLWSRPEAPFWVTLALDLALLDLWAYGWHRANHAWGLLWRFHRIHHLDQFLDTTSAVRFHPGEVLISALARAPLIVAADLPLATIALYDSAVFLVVLFHHSNLRVPARLEAALRLVIVTPSHHWVHHHAVHADTNLNYGAVLTLWDRLFASWSSHARTPDMAIGAEGAFDAPLPALAVKPFANAD